MKFFTRPRASETIETLKFCRDCAVACAVQAFLISGAFFLANFPGDRQQLEQVYTALREHQNLMRELESLLHENQRVFSENQAMLEQIDPGLKN